MTVDIANTSWGPFTAVGGSGNFESAWPNGADLLIVSTISQDQIHIAWPQVIAKGVVIERSLTEGSGYSPVYYAAYPTASVELYSHQPGTEYFYRFRYTNPDGTFSAYSSVNSATTTAVVNTYYVDPAGNDTTGDGSIGTPWATIQRGVWDLTAGDVLNVNAGTYTEAAEWPPSLGGGNPTTFSFA